jgi:hypothetical protein
MKQGPCRSCGSSIAICIYRDIYIHTYIHTYDSHSLYAAQGFGVLRGMCRGWFVVCVCVWCVCLRMRERERERERERMWVCTNTCVSALWAPFPPSISPTLPPSSLCLAPPLSLSPSLPLSLPAHTHHTHAGASSDTQRFTHLFLFGRRRPSQHVKVSLAGHAAQGGAKYNESRGLGEVCIRPLLFEQSVLEPSVQIPLQSLVLHLALKRCNRCY